VRWPNPWTHPTPHPHPVKELFMATLEVPRHAVPHAPASALDAAYSRIT